MDHRGTAVCFDEGITALLNKKIYVQYVPEMCNAAAVFEGRVKCFRQFVALIKDPNLDPLNKLCKDLPSWPAEAKCYQNGFKAIE